MTSSLVTHESTGYLAILVVIRTKPAKGYGSSMVELIARLGHGRGECRLVGRTFERDRE